MPDLVWVWSEFCWIWLNLAGFGPDLAVFGRILPYLAVRGMGRIWPYWAAFCRIWLYLATFCRILPDLVWIWARFCRILPYLAGSMEFQPTPILITPHQGPSDYGDPKSLGNSLENYEGVYMY